MKQSIGEALRDFARTTTPEELARKGTKLRSISVRHLTAMLSVAIDRALEERGLTGTIDERAALAVSARSQLKRMLAAREELVVQRDQVAELRAQIDHAASDAAAVHAGIDGHGEPGEHDPTTIGGTRDRVSILERRIEKLVSALEKTERSLEVALASFDSGLRSGARRAEGPGDDDPRREQKLDMMKGIFELNQGLDRS